MYFNGKQDLFGHVCVCHLDMGNKINISRIGVGGLAVR